MGEEENLRRAEELHSRTCGSTYMLFSSVTLARFSLSCSVLVVKT
jgi:hypothetical protein